MATQLSGYRNTALRRKGARSQGGPPPPKPSVRSRRAADDGPPWPLHKILLRHRRRSCPALSAVPKASSAKTATQRKKTGAWPGPLRASRWASVPSSARCVPGCRYSSRSSRVLRGRTFQTGNFGEGCCGRGGRIDRGLSQTGRAAFFHRMASSRRPPGGAPFRFAISLRARGVFAEHLAPGCLVRSRDQERDGADQRSADADQQGGTDAETPNPGDANSAVRRVVARKHGSPFSAATFLMLFR
jgi:hypothetical protein